MPSGIHQAAPWQTSQPCLEGCWKAMTSGSGAVPRAESRSQSSHLAAGATDQDTFSRCWHGETTILVDSSSLASTLAIASSLSPYEAPFCRAMAAARRTPWSGSWSSARSAVNSGGPRAPKAPRAAAAACRTTGSRCCSRQAMSDLPIERSWPPVIDLHSNYILISYIIHIASV